MSIESSPDQDLAVLAAFFNPCGYRSSVGNFRWFHQKLQRQGVKLIFAEIAFGDGPFELEDLGPVLQVRTENVMWQRERLVNHLIGMLPGSYTKIAWVDTDIVFSNEHWYAETSEALDSVPVVQPYRSAVWLDQQGGIMFEKLGVVAAADLQPHLLGDPIGTHPGFAWAARRELLEKHGVPDFCIVGGNDIVFANAIYGIQRPEEWDPYSTPLRKKINDWSKRFNNDINGSATHVDGFAYHLWHGNRKYRQYLERHRALRQYDFDPEVHIEVDGDGTWRWTTEDQGMKDTVMNFFRNRREDG